MARQLERDRAARERHRQCELTREHLACRPHPGEGELQGVAQRHRPPQRLRVGLPLHAHRAVGARRQPLLAMLRLPLLAVLLIGRAQLGEPRAHAGARRVGLLALERPAQHHLRAGYRHPRERDGAHEQRHAATGEQHARARRGHREIGSGRARVGDGDESGGEGAEAALALSLALQCDRVLRVRRVERHDQLAVEAASRRRAPFRVEAACAQPELTPGDTQLGEVRPAHVSLEADALVGAVERAVGEEHRAQRLLGGGQRGARGLDQHALGGRTTGRAAAAGRGDERGEVCGAPVLRLEHQQPVGVGDTVRHRLDVTCVAAVARPAVELHGGARDGRVGRRVEHPSEQRAVGHREQRHAQLARAQQRRAVTVPVARQARRQQKPATWQPERRAREARLPLPLRRLRQPGSQARAFASRESGPARVAARVLDRTARAVVQPGDGATHVRVAGAEHREIDAARRGLGGGGRRGGWEAARAHEGRPRRRDGAARAHGKADGAVGGVGGLEEAGEGAHGEGGGGGLQREAEAVAHEGGGRDAQRVAHAGL
eukprot:scaffold18322_cov53-Phaeocystis_antarctica.AAC.1